MSGRGTAEGVVFQAEFGAAAAALLLAERAISRLGTGLPGRPLRILFETPTAVDDVLVETDVGIIYVQAKRTISLSPKTDSELASVADQFVRQYRGGVLEGGVRRDLDPAKDRLLLAVSPDTVGTVSKNLREALDRNRTGAATAVPAHLTHALQVFSDHLDRKWKAASGQELSAEERQKILRLCSVTILSDSEKELATEALRDAVASVGDEAAAYGHLELWAAKAQADGVGGDAAAIRLALNHVNFKAPPSYAADVAKLLTHSEEVRARLRRFSELEAPEGRIEITRPVAKVVADAARGGSCVLTGDPGAGKSGVLHEIAVELAKQGPVVTFAVEASAVSLDTLRAEIGLQHQLIDVVKNMPRNRPAFLVLDALDAVRGGAAEATYRKLVEAVREIPGWHVVASVRSFDLRLGHEWRKQFRGTPPSPGHSDPTLAAVRHVHIGLLDETEKADLAAKSPSLAAAIEAGGPKMEELARNPFNLALLADLLCDGVAAASLSKVSSRGDLLERYWAARVGGLGIAGTTSLKAVVDEMIGKRSIDLADTKVPIAAAPMVDELQRVGVLAKTSNIRIGFRHHVLFDYAVARLLLFADIEEAHAQVLKDRGAGLLISPSVGYWLEYLRRISTAKDYWSVVARFVCDATIDPIVRVEIARLAVDAVDSPDGIADLAAVLTDPNPALARALGCLVGALHTKSLAGGPIFVAPWATLLAYFTEPSEDQLGALRALIGIVLDSSPSNEDRANAGKAARAVFDAATTPSLIRWLSPHILPYIARTFDQDVAASRKRLQSVLRGERFAQQGYVEVPWLAQHVAEIAPHDPELVVELYTRVFRGHDFSRDQTTNMGGSWILSLTSNAAQDFGMASHSLAEAYPKILSADAALGSKLVATVIRSEQEKAHALSEQQEAKSLAIAGIEYDFTPDHSTIWAWDAEADCHDDYSKVLRAYLKWISKADAKAIAEAPALILSETGIGLAWRIVFALGARRPKVLGDMLWDAATSETALNCSDTRREAIKLIAAVAPTIGADKLSAAEARWLASDYSHRSDPDKARKMEVGTILNAIGAEHLQADEARALLAAAEADKLSLENRKPYQFRMERGASRHWLEHEGVDVKAPVVANLIKLGKRVETAGAKAGDKQNVKLQEAVWKATLKLWQALDDAPKDLETEVEREAAHKLAEGLEQSIRRSSVPADQREVAIDRLLQIADHPLPESSAKTEEQFARSPSWGSPAPRIEAARSMYSLIRLNGMWPRLKEKYEHLLRSDPHPAVRFHLVRGLLTILHYDPEGAWKLIEQVAANETNATIIKQLGHILHAMRDQDEARVQAVVLQLVDRFPERERHEDGYIDCITALAIDKELPDSIAKIDAWIEDFASNEGALRAVIFDLQQRLILGFESGKEKDVAIRHRASALIDRIIATIEPTVRELPQRLSAPTPADMVAFKLFSEIGDQLYYGVGHGEQLPPWLKPLEVQRTYLSEHSALIIKLVTLGSPATVHHLIELVGKLVEANPELCFEIFSEAMLRTTGVAKYEHESMGASRFVELVGRYLADYRYLFDDDGRRARLIGCIAIFVEAGWPEARRLFQSLPDLLS